MKKKDHKRVAIVFDDLVEFFTMKNGIDALEKEGIKIDIIVPSDKTYSQELLDETYGVIKEQGYSVIRSVNKLTKYKILLEPYPTERYFPSGGINHEFRIKYKYSLMSAKPNPTMTVAWNSVYDAILCYTKSEVETLSAYTRTFLIAPMKYQGFKKTTDRPSKKPTLLYLPTFGDISSIDSINDVLGSLRNSYHVIVKVHHGTQYREDEKDRNDALKINSDECYDQATDLMELIKRADVVLSDNSAAIFEAIYTEVPVAIYNNGTLNDRRLGNINTPQYELVKKGVIPYTDNKKDVRAALESAIKNSKKQSKEKEDFSNSKNMTKEFTDVIKSFLGQSRENNYYALRDVINADLDAKSQAISAQEEKIKDLETSVSSILSSRTYRVGNIITSPYKIVKDKLKKEK